MQVNKNEISKEKYDRYNAMTASELNNAVKATLPDYIIWGYGYYGCYLEEKDGKYYLCMNIGSSCD